MKKVLFMILACASVLASDDAGGNWSTGDGGQNGTDRYALPWDHFVEGSCGGSEGYDVWGNPGPSAGECGKRSIAYLFEQTEGLNGTNG